MPLPWMTWILLAALPVTQNHNDASLESAREVAARVHGTIRSDRECANDAAKGTKVHPR